MNIKFKTYVLIFCSMLLNTSFAEIYKWNDMEGNLRYSDIPPEANEGTNIEEVNIKNRVNTYGNDNQAKKPLLEHKADTQYEETLKEKTLDYKKQVDRTKDEDVSAFIKQFKTKTADQANTANTTNTADTTNGATGSTGNTDQDSNSNPNSNTPVTNTDNNSLDVLEPQGKKSKDTTEILPLNPMNPKEIRQAKNCNTAQENLKKLASNNIIVAKNNKIQKLTDAELNSKIKEAKSQIAYYC